MENVPVFISVLFVLTTFLTLFFFYKASHDGRTPLIVLTGWLILQTLVGLSGFYQVTDTVPPRFGLLLGPPIVVIVMMFFTPGGRKFVDGLDSRYLTLLHAVRIPVELILFALFLNHAIPKLMTFEGGNLDMLSGLSALVVYYFGFVKHKLGKGAMIAWNLMCLALLINIVARAVLSFPSPFQQLAFDQPNIAVLYFPFIWLPCCVVPLVLFSQLVLLRRLFRSEKKTTYHYGMTSSSD